MLGLFAFAMAQHICHYLYNHRIERDRQGHPKRPFITVGRALVLMSRCSNIVQRGHPAPWWRRRWQALVHRAIYPQRIRAGCNLRAAGQAEGHHRAADLRGDHRRTCIRAWWCEQERRKRSPAAICPSRPG